MIGNNSSNKSSGAVVKYFEDYEINPGIGYGIGDGSG